MKIDSAKSFGKAVRKYRKIRGVTQIQLAAISNTGVRFIIDLENGKPGIQLEKALRTAKMLGMKIETTDFEGSEE